MTTSSRGWLAALLIPVVIVSGLTGAVVANAESVSQVRVAQDEYAEAWSDAEAVQSRVESERRDAAAQAVRAEQLIYTATAFQGLAHLNPESLAALTPLVAALESALAVDLPTEQALPERVTSGSLAELDDGVRVLVQWADSAGAAWSTTPTAAVVDAVQALESGIHAVATGAVAAGRALLTSKAGASADSRQALADALEGLAASAAAGGTMFASITAYVTAAQAVVDSQAAADAAAAAAAAAGQSGESTGADGGQPEVLVPYHWVLHTLKPEQTCADMMVIAGVRPGETAECWYVGGPEPVAVP